jgi:regulator of protease activity HflC (stomatin/prohibitin superfamily)
MEFVKQREKAEAERRAIQADGDKTAQIIAAEARAKTNEIEAQGRANALKIESEAQARANQLIAGSLTALVLQDKQIEAFRALSQSENAKVIITDGKTPLLGLPATGK